MTDGRLGQGTCIFIHPFICEQHYPGAVPQVLLKVFHLPLGSRKAHPCNCISLCKGDCSQSIRKCRGMRFEGTSEVVPWSPWCVTQKPYVSRRQIKAQAHWALPCHWNVVPVCWLLYLFHWKAPECSLKMPSWGAWGAQEISTEDLVHAPSLCVSSALLSKNCEWGGDSRLHFSKKEHTRLYLLLCIIL